MLPGIEATEPARTVIVPRVERPAARGRLRFLLPWIAFGAVAVVVVVGTTLWSVTLRSASRAAPERAGIDTAAAPVAPPSVAAPPTTPAAPTTTEAVVRSAAPRPRVVAPPPAPEPLSAEAPPSAAPPTDPAPATLPDPVACAEPLSCTASSAPATRSRSATTAPTED